MVATRISNDEIAGILAMSDEDEVDFSDSDSEYAPSLLEEMIQESSSEDIMDSDLYWPHHNIMKILQQKQWSNIINFILQSYFSELTTTCILWNNNFEFHLLPSPSNNVYIHIDPSTLGTSFSKDVYNFSAQDERFNANGIYYNDPIKKFVAVIEQAHCEGFLAFQDDIPLFAETFQKASSYSIWRTTYNRFLFVYAKENQYKNYFLNNLFENQANILIIEAEFMNSSIFSLKTNKFVGSISQHPEELVHLSTFNASDDTFYPPKDFFPKDRFKDLQGREIIVNSIDYRPYMAVDFNRLPQYYDHSNDNPSHSVHIDGTEIRICFTFCEVFNCTVQFDTSLAEDWNSADVNVTTDNIMGTIIDGRFHIIMGSMLAWYPVYATMDISTPISRSAVTCLVPRPSTIVSWSLPLTPFQFTLWLAVFLCILLETLVLVLARRFEQYLENNNNSWLYSVKFGYTTTLKLFISQSTNYLVKAHTLRTMLFAIYMLDIIISSIYAGGLSAILTVPTLEEAADSVERLYKHNLTWTGTSNAWVEEIKDEVDNLVIKQISANFISLNYEDIIQKSKTENMGFGASRMTHGHLCNIDFLTSESLKRLKLMNDDIYWSNTVVLTPRLWAFLAKYNDHILAWRTSGFDKYWEWKISANYVNLNKQNKVKESQYKDVDTDPVKLGLQNFSGLLIPWIMGMTFSILVFMGELLISYINKR